MPTVRDHLRDVRESQRGIGRPDSSQQPRDEYRPHGGAAGREGGGEEVQQASQRGDDEGGNIRSAESSLVGPPPEEGLGAKGREGKGREDEAVLLLGPAVFEDVEHDGGGDDHVADGIDHAGDGERDKVPLHDCAECVPETLDKLPQWPLYTSGRELYATN